MDKSKHIYGKKLVERATEDISYVRKLKDKTRISLMSEEEFYTRGIREKREEHVVK
jgi:hypothetical protein